MWYFKDCHVKCELNYMYVQLLQVPRQQTQNRPTVWICAAPFPANVLFANLTDSFSFFLPSFLPPATFVCALAGLAPAAAVFTSTAAGASALGSSGSAPFLFTSFVPHLRDLSEIFTNHKIKFALRHAISHTSHQPFSLTIRCGSVAELLRRRTCELRSTGSGGARHGLGRGLSPL